MAAQNIIDLCLVLQTHSLLKVILPHIYSALANQPAKVSGEDLSLGRLQYNCMGFEERCVTTV